MASVDDANPMLANRGRRPVPAPAVTLALFILFSCPVPTRAERRPIFVGAVIFAGGETRLDLADATATPLSLPPVFAGWGCYVGDTQRVGSGYTKRTTCGGRWGFVETFVTCDAKHPDATSILRLRQPIDSTKQEVDAAEKVTITVGCGYARR